MNYKTATEKQRQQKRDQARRYYIKNKTRVLQRNQIPENRILRNTYLRKWNKQNKLKRAMWSFKWYLHENYNLTFEQYTDLIKQQNNRCLICECEFQSRRHTHIDHCHKTGKIRGILCGYCNPGLGNFRDNPQLLRKAADYIEQWFPSDEENYLG